MRVPFSAGLGQGRPQAAAALRAVFAAHNVDLQRPVTTTCGSGVTAAVLALALERCGASQVRVYDGSWAEYAQQPGAAILQNPTAGA